MAKAMFLEPYNRMIVMSFLTVECKTYSHE